MRGFSRFPPKEVFGFLLVGGSTTIMSYATYLILLLAIPYTAAYVASFAIGIVWSYTVNARYVFKARWSWRGMFSYPFAYTAQIVGGVLIVYFSVRYLHVPNTLAPAIAITLTLPATYLLSRWIIRRDCEHPS